MVHTSYEQGCITKVKVYFLYGRGDVCSLNFKLNIEKLHIADPRKRRPLEEVQAMPVLNVLHAAAALQDASRLHLDHVLHLLLDDGCDAPARVPPQTS